MFNLLFIKSFFNRVKLFNTKTNFWIAFFRAILICIASLWQAAFKILTCSQITSGVYREFYWYQECFQGIWITCILLLILIILYFGNLAKKLNEQSSKIRINPINKYTKFVEAYKPKYWYWEFIVLTRRFCISLFVNISFVGSDICNLMLSVILCCYGFAHVYYQPYKHLRKNYMESYCLLSLIAGFVGVNFSDIENSEYLAVFLTIVICAPLIIALYCLIVLFSVYILKIEDRDEKAIRARTDIMMQRFQPTSRNLLKLVGGTLSYKNKFLDCIFS